MLRLERLWEQQNRTLVLLISGTIILAIALLDWWTKPYVSLGFFYLFPIMLTAGFLPRWAVVLLGVVCAVLSETFSSLDPADSIIRSGFEALALAGCGLFVAELLRNRRLMLEAEERLRILVETSPAAIVTVDERGFIERANPSRFPQAVRLGAGPHLSCASQLAAQAEVWSGRDETKPD